MRSPSCGLLHVVADRTRIPFIILVRQKGASTHFRVWASAFVREVAAMVDPFVTNALIMGLLVRSLELAGELFSL